MITWLASCLVERDVDPARILVVWSPEAEAAARRAGHLVDLRSQYLVDLADTVMADSGVTASVELAGAEVLVEPEPPLVPRELLALARQRLTDPASELATLRARHRADVVAWIVDTDTAPSGVAQLLDGRSPSDPFDAVAVVQWDAPELVFPHELFHVYGADHSWLQQVAEGELVEGYGHGWTAPGVLAHTIMADASECTWAGAPLSACDVVPRLSNPAVQAWGEPLGDVRTAYNACVVQQRARYVSRLYELATGEDRWDASLAPSCPVVLGPGRDLEGTVCLAESADWTGCTDLRGTVRVEDPERLRGVERVTGDLLLSGPGVGSLAALSGLRSVGGTLTLRDTALVDLAGLEQLERVGGLVIEANPALVGLSALRVAEVPGSLLLVGNAGLRHLDGPVGIERAGVLWVTRHPVLEDLAALRGLRGVSGGLAIWGNPRLVDCALPELDEEVRQAVVLFDNGEGCVP
ncbi:MAG: hypothetical protein KC621_25320 [Myxococcales bacterium]|nr:hypothetical protein [Myxococcales bacterium]